MHSLRPPGGRNGSVRDINACPRRRQLSPKAGIVPQAVVPAYGPRRCQGYAPWRVGPKAADACSESTHAWEARRYSPSGHDLLFKASAETTLKIAATPRHLGARIGFMWVLHTWGSAMTQNPHS